MVLHGVSSFRGQTANTMLAAYDCFRTIVIDVVLFSRRHFVAETGLCNHHYTMSERPMVCYAEHGRLWIWRSTQVGRRARITRCNDGKHFSFRLTFKNKNVLPFTDRVVVLPQQRISLFSIVIYCSRRVIKFIRKIVTFSSVETQFWIII